GEGASGNFVGDLNPNNRNFIYSNEDGVLIEGQNTSDNIVRSNRIGVDSTGAPQGNKFTGITIQDRACRNLIGGTDKDAGNLISANGTHGMFIAGFAADNTIVGNNIGTNADGELAPGVGNTFTGIDV